LNGVIALILRYFT